MAKKAVQSFETYCRSRLVQHGIKDWQTIDNPIELLMELNKCGLGKLKQSYDNYIKITGQT